MENKKKKCTRRRILSLTCAALLLIGGVIAYLTDSASFTNTFNMTSSGVNIVAQEFTAADDTGTYVDPIGVKAGDLIAKVPAVANKSADNDSVWVRARIEYTQPLADMTGYTQLTDSSLAGLDLTRWTKQGEYYYLNSGIDKGSTSYNNLFTGVRIPADWDNAMTAKTPVVKVTFEAVQKSNVTQNTAVANPWGDATAITFETVAD
jgi:predicted ribosomally synthesized peptide with SipW-like signal peptide